MNVVKDGAQEAAYVYNGDGMRVKEVAAGVTTVMLGQWYEQNVNTGAVTTYYYAAGQRVALRVTQSGGASTVSYPLADHLGSTAITLDSSGTKIAELRYQPYGSVRYTWGITPTEALAIGGYVLVGTVMIPKTAECMNSGGLP